jgi:hypothetical protein
MAAQNSRQLTVAFSEQQRRKIERIAQREKRTTADILKIAMEVYNDQLDFGVSGGIRTDHSTLINIVEHLSHAQRDELEAQLRATKGGRQRPYKIKQKVIFRSKTQIIRHSQIIIAAVNETLSYDPIRYHNLSPPDLWLNDADYREELRNLVGELRRLNALLENSTTKVSSKKDAVAGVASFARRFIKTYSDSFSRTAGKGSWYLLVGAIVALLYEAGVGQDIISDILAAIKAVK